MKLFGQLGVGPFQKKGGPPVHRALVRQQHYMRWAVQGQRLLHHHLRCGEGRDLPGIIGMGNIGSRVAKIAEAFGMKVCYYSTSGTGHCKEYPSLTLEELLSTSDVVSIHAPLNERTSGLIGKDELAMMKPTAILVNMGRGGIVDEQALADAVDNGAISGAALDVFVKEPLPAENPLLHVRHPERLRLAPHAAWASVEARIRLVQQIADNIAKGY